MKAEKVVSALEEYVELLIDDRTFEGEPQQTIPSIVLNGARDRLKEALEEALDDR